MDALLEYNRGIEEENIGDIYEGIEQLIASSANYKRRGQEDLAGGLLRQAWREFLPFQDILQIYLGSDELEQKLIAALSSLDSPFAVTIEQETPSIERTLVLAGTIAA